MEGTVGGTQPVKVTIKNKGIDYLDSCVINWTVNGVLQSPVVWRGHLFEDFNDTITLGYYTQRYNMIDTVVVCVGMPNGVVDTTTWDDTLSVVSYGCYGPISGDLLLEQHREPMCPVLMMLFSLVPNVVLTGMLHLNC